MTSEPTEPAAPATPRTGAISIPGGLPLLAFIALVLTGGAAPVAVRFTFVELQPLWSGGLRFALGAGVFWLLVAIYRLPVPKGAALRSALLYGALASGISPIMVLLGLARTPASLFQTLMALMPLLTIFFAALHGQEQVRRRGLLGAALALVGIALAVGGLHPESVSLPHLLLIAAAAACTAEAGVIAKGMPESHPVATSAVGLTIGSLIVLTASRIAGDAWILPTQTTTRLAFIYALLMGVIGGFGLYLYILGAWTASAASYVFILTPLVTVVVAALLAGEQITPLFLVGTALVLVGVYVGALLRSRIKAPIPIPDE